MLKETLKETSLKLKSDKDSAIAFFSDMKSFGEFV